LPLFGQSASILSFDFACIRKAVAKANLAASTQTPLSPTPHSSHPVYNIHARLYIKLLQNQIIQQRPENHNENTAFQFTE
jgi:hypothetical protein